MTSCLCSIPKTVVRPLHLVNDGIAFCFITVDLILTSLSHCVLYAVAVSDAEETIAWMVEKDPMLSTDDYGRDLASVQALQRKHDTLERDLNALEDKVGSIVVALQHLMH